MQSATEELHELAPGLDQKEDAEILAILLNAQIKALKCVQSATGAVAKAAEVMAETIRNGGRLVFGGAGSSALMAVADATELGGTFGVPAKQVSILMAGGIPRDARMPGGVEDDIEAARNAMTSVSPVDALVAVSASGRTPYTIELLRCAQKQGAATIGIANAPDTPVLDRADIPICLLTQSEVVAGSTRLGAGTAQKAALNMMSTLMGIRLGHIHDGMLVNLCADNAKLHERAVGMVAQISKVSECFARECLETARGQVKPAVLLASGVETLVEATAILEQNEGHLREALADVSVLPRRKE